MQSGRQFEKFSASELHCAKCRRMSPVREKLLLVLPGVEIYDYRCKICGESLGSREVKSRARAAGSITV